MGLGRSLQGDKQGKRFKLATRASRVSNIVNGNSALKENKERKSKKVEGGESRAISVSFAGESKGTRKGVSGRRNVKTRSNGERHETPAQGNKSFKSLNFDKKRKIGDAELITAEEIVSDHNAGRFNRKSQSKMGKDMHRDNSYERKTIKGKLHKLEQSSQNAHVMNKSKKDERGRNAKMKKSAISISVVKKQSEEQIDVAAVSAGRPSKKKGQDKKSTTADSEGMDEPPKKKRRRIKIDPYDTSNKKLDDGIIFNNNVRKKEEDSKHRNAELSKNAQFRAIVPSPSILSFVEDNLLGRRREIEFRRAGYNIELSAPLDNIPHSSSSERERIEETVFRNKLTFFAAAKISSSFPPPELPEIAFAGRSNVGKSSLLNTLTRQWGVVRTSDKPGLTQTVNFFKLASKLCLVDLPGYGFAYAKEEVKEAWEQLVKEYVSTRVGLKRVCLLVDTKWGMKPRDHELIDLMERSQTKYQIVLTKTDMVFPIDVARRAMQIEESLKEKKSAVQPVMMVSSKTGAGVRSLRTVLAKIARFVKP